MAQAAPWKVGRIPSQRTANVVDLTNTARNAFNNRFDIIDKAVSNLQFQKDKGELTDIEFINSLKRLQERQKGGFFKEGAESAEELGQQAEEAVAKQAYQDFVDQQKRGIQKTLDTADIKFAQVQDDFEKGKIGEDAYKAQKDAYFNLQRNRADLEASIPKFSFQQFRRGSELNQYSSGRLRDIERERQIRKDFQSVFGQGKFPGASNLFDAAGSYLPTSTIKDIFRQQKIAGFGPNQAGKLPDSFRYEAPKYQFPGTGGAPAKPNEQIYNRNIFR